MAPVASPLTLSLVITRLMTALQRLKYLAGAGLMNVDQEAIEASLQAHIDLQITPTTGELEYLGNELHIRRI